MCMHPVVVHRLLTLLLPIACFDIHVYLQRWHQSLWYVTEYVDQKKQLRTINALTHHADFRDVWTSLLLTLLVKMIHDSLDEDESQRVMAGEASVAGMAGRL